MSASTSHPRKAPDSETCWALLERVAASTPLRRAARLRELLLYVGRRSLKEGCDELHESEIGSAVFERPADYDTSADTIVRVNATELRKRIENYFESEGTHETLVMEIPRGSYLPVFRYQAAEARTLAEIAVLPAAVSELPRPISGARRISDRHRWILAGLVITVLAFGWATSWIQNRAMYRALYPYKYSPSVGALWSEFLDTDQDTDIVMEDSGFLLVKTLSRQVFSLNTYLDRSYLRKLQAENLSPDMHSALDVIASKNLGRASAFSLERRILLLDPQGKNLHLYHARDYMPALIAHDNVVLFGNPTVNPWFELFENRLNFTEIANDGYSLSPVTNRAPAPGEQSIYTPTDGVQYCVVAYLPNPEHNGKILLVQGTASESTEAGGDFLLSESQMSSFQNMLHVTRFPYFELLLKTTAVSGTHFTTTIVAYRTYPTLH